MGKSRVKKTITLAVTLILAMAAPGRKSVGQEPPSATLKLSPQLPTDWVVLKGLPPGNSAVPTSLPAPKVGGDDPPLFDFADYNVKFDVASLMNVLRDNRHEGWVLAAYPDPKTSRPLIGAGFSLDLEAREHRQSDPLNPHTFLEPSSAQLWQAAGLDPERLQSILEQFERNLKAWKKKNYRKKINAHKLPPQLTEDEATSLLRVSTEQAIHNARAYCRNFDELTAAQQMALSQLVFQMGVNLEEFVQFLGALNGNPTLENAALREGSTESQREQWKAVQQTLIQSQWAKHYRNRAVAVIAMFDLDYAEDPRAAEHGVEVVLRPPAKHRRKKVHAGSVRAANEGSPVKVAH